MRFTSFDEDGKVVFTQVYYSIGGGFILSADEFANASTVKKREVPYAFSSADQLLELCKKHSMTIAEIVLANEIALLSDPTIVRRIDRIVSPQRPDNPAPVHLEELTPERQVKAAILTLWRAMEDCIARGIATEGTLPGGLNVRRRAPGLARRLAQLDAKQDEAGKTRDPLAPLDSVTLVAMAVNEENAAGGRVVTAPTNGAAGVVPAIAYYWMNHASDGLSGAEKEDGLLRYFLTSAAIGILYKENASISGAEVGCQGEVGVACSMAAGGLVAALGGDALAIESAAEIAMEHNLGMTCDPIGGLVQIPCIERNGMGAVKAVNAARLAMNDQGVHKVSLDQVIETMYRTGMDMQSRYKETSLAGLALNIIEC
jgi:L-serine dehydratase